MKKAITLILTLTMLLGLCAFSGTVYAADEITVTDMIGREVTVTPGSYERVVCIGAGALRMYSYIGDVSLLCGVEDIDNTSLAERPKMFDSVARPYMLAYGESFKALPSCGVGGPQAQTAEAEKILACNPDIVISEYEDVEKEDALQEQLGVPVITLKAGPGGVFDENFFGTMRMLGTRARGDLPPHRRCCRRGQALRVHLRPRQLGHHQPPHDRAELHLLQRGECEERCHRSGGPRHPGH